MDEFFTTVLQQEKLERYFSVRKPTKKNSESFTIDKNAKLIVKLLLRSPAQVQAITDKTSMLVMERETPAERLVGQEINKNNSIFVEISTERPREAKNSTKSNGIVMEIAAK